MNKTSLSCRGTFHAGEWIEVRTKEEILATLDSNGRLEALPFMPEMFQYCGQRFRVYKRAHKTCDPPNGLGGRRMLSAVHLEGIRCGGQYHGGCQAGCLLFWKEAWLKKVSETKKAEPAPHANGNGCTEDGVIAGTRAGGGDAEAPVYVCQSTQISSATQPLPWWDLRQYWEDLTSGNVRPSQMLAAFLFFLYQTMAEAGIGLGSALRWAYDNFQKWRGGSPYPTRRGKVLRGKRTPRSKLDFEAGDTVKVKDFGKILETLDEDSRNRGMYFDAEAVPFCNGTYRVRQRVQQIINEKTGKMMHFKTDAIILEDVFCQARYATCRRFCPRSIYTYWREIWLERIAERDHENAG
jgi:hypothetical protein